MVLETNLKKIVELNVIIISFFGIMWPEKTGWKLTFSSLKTYTVVVFFLATLTISEAVSVYQNFTGVEQVSSSLFLFLTHIQQIFKYQRIFSNQKKLRDLIESIERYEFMPKSLQQQNILERYITTSKIVTKVLLSACFATCVFWTVYPYTEDEMHLPLAGWFPWDVNKSPQYELTFVYQILSVTVNGFIICSIDTLMSGLLMVICAQFHLLNDTLVNLKDFSQTEINIETNNNEIIPDELQNVMNGKLQECVVHHLNILKFADEVSFIFSPCILGQMGLTVIIICVTLFCLTSIPFGTMKFFSMILYLFCILMEIFLWCFFGNEVMLQSEKVTKCSFELDWDCCSLKFKKNLLFFMTRSQKELKMYAGGFFTLSLNTFCTMIKSSWSYFAVLVQISDE